MGKRITSLTEITTVTENDYIPVDNAATGARKLSADFINDLEDEIDGKQDALTAGANISITQDGTISATDTTYTAGTNVDITNGVISATDTTYTAGTNITITNGEISATDTDTLSGLTDTTISSPSDGDALVYDSTSGKWVNGGVASDIGDLNDVDITSPSNGQVLSYNSTSQEWENTTPSAGSSVSVTQVQSTGTKIATVTVDNVDTDLYAPTGGSASSYGYTTPSSSSGSDGDIYNKIEDITGTDETVTTPVSVTTNTTFQFPKSISEYSTITVTGSNGGTDFEPQTVAVENIGTDMSHQTYIGTSGIMWYKTTDSVVMWATNAEITSCYGTYTDSHKIVDIYQKTSNSWSKYEDKGSIVVANPSGTATTDLEKISIDGTVYDIPSGGSGGSSIIDEIWTGNETPPTTGTVITLTEKWNDYDFLCFLVTNTTASDAPYSTPIIMTKDMAIDTKNLQAAYSYNRFDVVITPKSDTTLQIERPSSSGTAVIYKKIYGIKLGSGGSSGGGNLYGTTDPTSDLGNNGDIYMKYQGGSEPVESDYETAWSGSISCANWASPVTVPDVNPGLYHKLRFTGTDANAVEFLVEDIAINPNWTQLSSNINYMWIQISADGTELKMTSGTGYSSTLTLVEGTKMEIHPTQILNVYGKVEDEWAGFPGGGLITTYYARNGQISDGTNQQFITVQLDQPIEEGSDYVMVIKNTIDGTPVQKAFFNYLNFGNYYSTTVYGGSSIKTMSLQITATSIACIDYGGSWQDIYIDVYRTVKHSSSNTPFVNYSTSEQVVGTWIDGKPVYELTFPLTIRCNIPAEQTYDINDYITDGDFLIDYKLYYVNSPNVHDMTGTIPRMQFWKNNNIQYIAYNGLGIGAIDFTSTYATFRYTKTTDV